MHRGASRPVPGILTAVLLAGPACEDPPQPAAQLVFVLTVPVDGARDVPLSVVPRLEFNVPLDPSVVGPDTFRLRSGELQPGGTVSYSVVDRSVTFTPGVNLRARLAYAARLDEGVRGIDGSLPRRPAEIVFVTGTTELPRDPPPADPAFEADVWPILEARCSACHSAPRASARLELWPSERLADLARRTSSEWPEWRILAPGSPERSYLLYKTTGVPGLVGRRMPPDEGLGRPEARILERWIALGAPR